MTAPTVERVLGCKRSDGWQYRPAAAGWPELFGRPLHGELVWYREASPFEEIDLIVEHRSGVSPTRLRRWTDEEAERMRHQPEDAGARLVAYDNQREARRQDRKKARRIRKRQIKLGLLSPSQELNMAAPIAPTPAKTKTAKTAKAKTAKAAKAPAREKPQWIKDWEAEKKEYTKEREKFFAIRAEFRKRRSAFQKRAKEMKGKITNWAKGK